MKLFKKLIKNIASPEPKETDGEAKKEKKSVTKAVRKIFQKTPKKTTSHKKKSLLEKTIEQVDMLLKLYNEFIKKDFLIVLSEAQARLREWKNHITNLLGKGNSIEEITSLSSDLQDIRQIYNEAELAISSILVDCKDYQSTISTSKNLIPSIAIQAKIQIQMEQIIKNLHKGLEISDINYNEDYRFLDSHLKKYKERVMSR